MTMPRSRHINTPPPAPQTAARAMDSACRQLGLAALFQRMADREEAALTEFHAIMADRLYSMALRMLDDREAAAEVLQDTMVRLWHTAARFDPARGDGFTWSAMTLRGLCLDRLRRRQRERSGSANHAARELAAGTPGGMEDLFFRETITLVQKAMESLDPADRDCLCTALFKPETNTEYAAALGLSTGALKVRIHRAMQRLRTLLAPHTEP
jgi:RNA polymerase sigma-70 factor (ECF subfamily)